MKISQIHLNNFKRFSSLAIKDIPDNAKLVLLIGSNGSGKSSVFDAFTFIDTTIKKDTSINDSFWAYFKKKKNEVMQVSLLLNDTEYVISDDNFSEIHLDLPKTTFYGRTSFRQIPRLTRTTLGQSKVDFDQDTDRPRFFIERDSRFENDIEKITETILKDFFRFGQSNEQIRQKYISPINNALENIFGNINGTKLQLIEIIPPLDGNTAQINFRKGASEIHYNYLSAGEKEVFNLLINLLSRSKHYQDSIYFFDEIDLHLNTKIQFNLLKEITENWIPDNSQLWIASHSLGFIEYAKQSERACIIDFDDLDFDLPQVLYPQPKDNPEIYEIAVGKEILPSLFQQMNIYFVENKDKEFYANVNVAHTIFVPENNRNSVYHKVRTTQYKGIVDRDFLTDEDIALIKQYYPNLIILAYYSVENYLFHPENLQEYYSKKQKNFDSGLYIKQLTEAKNQVKDTFIPTLMLKRTEYPYFGEPEYNGKSLQNRFKNKEENQQQSTILAQYLNSNDFETFYKVLPMKSYCTNLPQRQNISKIELSKTSWFSEKIKTLLTTR